MPFNLKAATPDTSMPSTGFLFGADSQAATDPALYDLAVIADAMAALRRPFTQVTAQRTLASVTTPQALFDSGSDALTVEASTTYLFDGLLLVKNMGTTTGNAQIDLLGAGTATIANIFWKATGIDSNTPATATNQPGSWHETAASAQPVVTAQAAAQLVLEIKGIVRISGAGTLIPSIALNTAIAATVEIGTHLRFERMCANSVAAVGAWG